VTNGLGLGIDSDYIRWIGANYHFRNSPNLGDVMFHININRGEDVLPSQLPFSPTNILAKMIFKWYTIDDSEFESKNQIEVEITKNKWYLPNTTLKLSKSSESEVFLKKGACLMTTSNSLLVFGNYEDLQAFKKRVCQYMCNKDYCSGDDIDINRGPVLTLIILDDQNQAESTTDARTIVFKPVEYLY